jgi:hypothetical protein
MKEKALWGIAVVALGLGAWAVFTRPNPASAVLGTAGSMLVENYDAYNRYNDGYKSENEIVLSGADGDITTGDDLVVADDATVSGGSLSVTTSNTATSTLQVGCIQTTATNTATAIRLVASTTSLVNGVSTGVMLVQFGSCPI